MGLTRFLKKADDTSQRPRYYKSHNILSIIVSLTIMITLCYTFIDNYEVHNIQITQLP
jgi:low affinity Fe/Cu permease